MVATVEGNTLVHELFEPRDLVPVTGPSDWVAVIEKAIEVLPLSKLRGFDSAKGSLESIVHISLLTGMGHTAEDKPFEFCYCEGLGENTHIRLFFVLHIAETARKLRVKYLVITRKGNFFIAESNWDIRLNKGGIWLSDDRICYLKSVSFTPTTMQEVCSDFEFEVCERHLRPLSVGAAVIRELGDRVDKTRAELWRQYRALESTQHMMDEIVRRVDAVTLTKY